MSLVNKRSGNNKAVAVFAMALALSVTMKCHATASSSSASDTWTMGCVSNSGCDFTTSSTPSSNLTLAPSTTTRVYAYCLETGGENSTPASIAITCNSPDMDLLAFTSVAPGTSGASPGLYFSVMNASGVNSNSLQLTNISCVTSTTPSSSSSSASAIVASVGKKNGVQVNLTGCSVLSDTTVVF